MKFSTVEILELDKDDLQNLNDLTSRLDDLGDYTDDQIWATVSAFCEERNLKKKDISNMIRMVMTGKRYHVGTQTILYVDGLERFKEKVNWCFTFPNIALEKKEHEGVF